MYEYREDTAMGLQGRVTVPGDKSISHRSLMFAALSPKPSLIKGLLQSEDVLSTAECLSSCGIGINNNPAQQQTLVTGKRIFSEPTTVLDAGNSGTTMRLLTGLLSGQKIYTVMTGDSSLRSRPMRRVITPLRQMGACLFGRQNDQFAPLTTLPVQEPLKGIMYDSPIASAQVKSAVLLANLFAEGETVFREPAPSRDHTERMLSALGIKMDSFRVGDSLEVRCQGGQAASIESREWEIPGDFSSAAFLIVAALCIPHSDVCITGVNVNPLRTGLMRVLNTVGAKITLENEREQCGEPVADLLVKSQVLTGNITLAEVDIPGLIDEIPVLAVAGAFLNGTLTVHGAEELRKKESDRIETVATEFRKLGITIETLPDGLVIHGNPDRQLSIPATPLASYGDHRIAMALTVLLWIAHSRGQIAERELPIQNAACVAVSFPTFYTVLSQLESGGIAV
jgi:3-phosphoshikimate 1-carboxyvinyltransferase